MPIEVQVDFTGMSLIHLAARKKSRGSKVHFGKAYLVGKGHEPRLSVPIHHVRAIKGLSSRLLLSPGGFTLVEIDLSDKELRFGTLPGPGVTLGPADEQEPDAPPLQTPWQYLRHAVDLGVLSGERELEPHAPSLAAAIVHLDRGRLCGAPPADARMAYLPWKVDSKHKKSAHVQALSDRVRLHIHSERDLRVTVLKHGSVVGTLKVGQPVIGPTAWNNRPLRLPGMTQVPIAVYSICEFRPGDIADMKDVELYRPFLKGSPAYTTPTVDAERADGSHSCPPGVVIRDVGPGAARKAPARPERPKGRGTRKK